MKNEQISALLLDWYKIYGRDLPWRIKGGAHPNPYMVLVSEFMLQQTTVKTVIPYFKRFIERFPSLKSLAESKEEEVYLFWQGLGYYSRAANLRKTAQMIIENYNGYFPQEKSEIIKLKGIGPYTAASIVSLAFNKPETIIDGNVTRIICRMYHLTNPTDEIKSLIFEKAAELTNHKNPADYASAIMDLGALVCTPKNPRCQVCPWQKFCQSVESPDIEKIPFKKKILPKEKNGFVYLISNNKGEFFIRKRTETGLLSGLYEFPWSENKNDFAPEAYRTPLSVSHVFTHFKLTLHICTLRSNHCSLDGNFVPAEKFADYPFSTLMKKVFQAFLSSSNTR